MTIPHARPGEVVDVRPLRAALADTKTNSPHQAIWHGVFRADGSDCRYLDWITGRITIFR